MKRAVGTKQAAPMSDQALQLACCIRRAHNGPIGGREFLRDEKKRRSIGRLDPLNDYWHTREACHEITRQLGIFFPDVISLYEHTTSQMSDNVIAEQSATTCSIPSFSWPK